MKNEKSEVLLYTPAMPCTELDRMREQATSLRQRILDQRHKARVTAENSRTGRMSGKSEMVPFLQRKLQNLASKIEQHVNAHKCQD
jgi:hypothetical protein